MPDTSPAADGVRRGHVDGLCAFSVLSILFCHYGVPGFGGGYSGIDAGFVLAGALLAQRARADPAAGGFSILGFYEQCLRRLLPALIVTVTATLIAGPAILFQEDLRRLTATTVYALAFVSNIIFERTLEAYTVPASEPLLHTWPLAILAQFCLFFPLIALGVGHPPRRWAIVGLILLTLLSLAASIVAVRVAPGDAMYFLRFRGWEPLAGALFGLFAPRPPESRAIRSGVFVLGIALLVGADLWLGKRLLYPGEAALVPCCGTLLVLWAGRDGARLPWRLLDNAIVRHVGERSYSLYLVHWPIYALAQYYFYTPLTTQMRAALLFASALLAELVWRYVERPFRAPSRIGRRGRFIAGAGAATAMVAGIAVALHWATPTPQWALAPQNTAHRHWQVDEARCNGAAPQKIAQSTACRIGDFRAPLHIVFWGDSHARTLVPALAATAIAHHDQVLVAEMDGCTPVPGTIGQTLRAPSTLALRAALSHVGLQRHDDCLRHNAAVLNWIKGHRIDTVVLASGWYHFAAGEAAGAHYPRFVLRDVGMSGGGRATNADVLKRRLSDLLAELQHRHLRVFIVEDVPHLSVDTPYALQSIQRLGMPCNFCLSRAEYERQDRLPRRIFAELAPHFEVTWLKPQDILCAGKMCRLAERGAPYYYDDNHLSPAGALALRRTFEPVWAGR